jgi:hypothetical protein
VTLALTVTLVVNHHFAITRNSDELAALVRHVAHTGRIAHDTVRLALDLACYRRPRSRTADVERAHLELRALLADRLRGNDTYCFADIHRNAAA